MSNMPPGSGQGPNQWTPPSVPRNLPPAQGGNQPPVPPVHGGHNTIAPQPSNPNKRNVKRTVIASGLTLAALGGVIGGALWLGSGGNHENKSGKPAAAEQLFRATPEQFIATYGNPGEKETVHSYGTDESHLLREGRFTDAAQDIKNTEKYNSEIAATLLTEGGYHQENVKEGEPVAPVADINAFARDDNGNIIDQKGYNAAVNKLGNWLFTNSELNDKGQPIHAAEYAKVKDAQTWLDKQIDAQASHLTKDDVVYLAAGKPIRSSFLWENNAGDSDPYYKSDQESVFLKVTINGHQLLLRSNCNWQVSGIVKEKPAPVVQQAVWKPAAVQQQDVVLKSYSKPYVAPQGEVQVQVQEQEQPQVSVEVPQVTIPQFEIPQIPGLPKIDIPNLPQTPITPQVPQLTPKNPSQDFNINPQRNPETNLNNTPPQTSGQQKPATQPPAERAQPAKPQGNGTAPGANPNAGANRAKPAPEPGANGGNHSNPGGGGSNKGKVS